MLGFFRRSVGLLLFAALLSGCGSVAHRKAAQTSEIGTPLEPIKALRLSGRLSIKQGKEAQFGNLRWLHDAPHHEIALLSPLGSTVANIVQDFGKVTLTTSKRETYQAADADRLMQSVLGWHLPLNGMQYWVLGKPAPPEQDALTEVGPDQRLARLTQQNWRIEYSNYVPVGNAAFPGKIVMRRDDIEIRFVVDSIVPVADQH